MRMTKGVGICRIQAAGKHRVKNHYWGDEETVVSTPYYMVRVLTICAGESTDVHYHQVRYESIMALEGELRLLRARCSDILLPGATVNIPNMTPHRLVNEGDKPIRVLEVCTAIRNDDHKMRPRDMDRFLTSAYGVKNAT